MNSYSPTSIVYNFNVFMPIVLNQESPSLDGQVFNLLQGLAKGFSSNIPSLLTNPSDSSLPNSHLINWPTQDGQQVELTSKVNSAAQNTLVTNIPSDDFITQNNNHSNLSSPSSKTTKSSLNNSNSSSTSLPISPVMPTQKPKKQKVTSKVNSAAQNTLATNIPSDDFITQNNNHSNLFSSSPKTTKSSLNNSNSSSTSLSISPVMPLKKPEEQKVTSKVNSATKKRLAKKTQSNISSSSRKQDNFKKKREFVYWGDPEVDEFVEWVITKINKSNLKYSHHFPLQIFSDIPPTYSFSKRTRNAMYRKWSALNSETNINKFLNTYDLTTGKRKSLINQVLKPSVQKITDRPSSQDDNENIMTANRNISSKSGTGVKRTMGDDDTSEPSKKIRSANIVNNDSSSESSTGDIFKIDSIGNIPNLPKISQSNDLSTISSTPSSSSSTSEGNIEDLNVILPDELLVLMTVK